MMDTVFKLRINRGATEYTRFKLTTAAMFPFVVGNDVLILTDPHADYSSEVYYVERSVHTPNIQTIVLREINVHDSSEYESLCDELVRDGWVVA